MKKRTAKRLKKTAAALVCCGLCVATGMLGSLAIAKMPQINGKTAYANGFVYLQDDSDSIKIDRLDESFFAPGDLKTGGSTNKYFKYNQKAKDWIMPGGSKDGSVSLTNYGSKAVPVYVYAKSSDASAFAAFKSANSDMDYSAAQFKYLSDLLVSDENKLKLNIYQSTKSGEKLVYSGSVDGKGSADSEANNKVQANRNKANNMDGFGNAIFLGYLYPDMDAKYPDEDEWSFDIDGYDSSYEPQSTSFRFELTASKDLKSYLEGEELANYPANRATVDHGYAGSIALIDWVFVIPPEEIKAPNFPTPDPTTTTTTKKPTPVVPGTGDASIPYAAASAACGISALVIFFVAFGEVGKKKKEEE